MRNSYALITGASGGIGRDLADCFAADGIPLILVARNRQKLKEAQAEVSEKYTVDVQIYPLDLSINGSAEKLHEWAGSQELMVRYLVNNAGLGDKADVNDAKLERLQKMIRLNVEALVSLSKLFGADMVIRRQGNIVNIASVAGLVPGPGMAVYYATKAFVLNFSQALAAELSEDNVIVTAVCPGATRTGFATAAGAEGTRLFSGNLPSSKEMAEFSYKSMQAGVLVAIWGWQNRIMSRIIGLLPRRKVLSVVRRVQ